MKLYATVTSERASKGQGGNEFLDIMLYGDNKTYLGTVSLFRHSENMFRLNHTAFGGEIITLWTYYIKGEKQKTV